MKRSNGKVSPTEVTKRIRVGHTIRRSKSIRLPSDYIFFDTETDTIGDGRTQKLKLIHACYWHTGRVSGKEKIEWFKGMNGKELYEWIVSYLRKGKPVRLLSSNIWFDLRVSGLLTHFKAAGWLCTRFFARGHTFIASFARGKYKIICLNIQNYFAYPVNLLGESIGLPKLKIDFKTATDEEYDLYCKRDVEIIYKAYRALHEFMFCNSTGSIGYTLPGTSYSCYVHSFLPHPIDIHTEEDILKMERSSYFGGRVECFRIGEFRGEKFYKLDVNGMYPYVMKCNDYPVKYVKTSYKATKEVLLEFAYHYCYVAHVKLETGEPVYPYRKEGKVIFPTGVFETYLTTPSLLYALEHDHVREIIKVAVYAKANLFYEFVRYFYTHRLDYRKQGNLAFAFVCKIILNSLYGKFGQRNSVIVEEKKTDSNKNVRKLIYDRSTRKTYIHQIFYGLEQIICLQEEEAMNSMPAICAHVTDYARIYLWQLITKVGIKNCYYCDTDSLIVNEKGYRTLRSMHNEHELGKIKVEAESDTMTIRTAKDYRFGKVEKIKGIPLKHKKIGDNTYQYTYFPTSIRELREELKEDYRIETLEKSLTLKYDKGIVLKSGKVKPYKLEE